METEEYLEELKKFWKKDASINNRLPNWSFNYRMLMNADLSGKCNKDCINTIFRMVLELIVGFVNMNFHEDYGCVFEVMSWSIVKYFLDKLVTKVEPIIQIRYVPFIYRNEIYLEVKCNDRSKWYKFRYSKGIEEITQENFNIKFDQKPCVNSEEYVTYIPLKMTGES